MEFATKHNLVDKITIKVKISWQASRQTRRKAGQQTDKQKKNKTKILSIIRTGIENIKVK